MRFPLALVVLLLLASPASAQLVVPLTTPDGRVACTQGMTGIGRPPDWRAIADPDGPDGWTLAETAGDPTDLRFPLGISEQAVTRDLDATLRFKPLSGTRARVAGLVFRAQSANDYYVVRTNALDSSVRLYRMDKGKRSQLAGKPLFEATDRSLLLAGAMGVWSQADSVTHFGSILVGPPMR